MTHPTKRCDTCEFWDCDDQWSTANDDKRHRDDWIGNCHRNAVHPTLGDYEYHVLQALWLIAPEDDDLNQHWEECMLQTSSWPSTNARDWCGEWLQRERPIKNDEPEAA